MSETKNLSPKLLKLSAADSKVSRGDAVDIVSLLASCGCSVDKAAIEVAIRSRRSSMASNLASVSVVSVRTVAGGAGV